MRLFLPFLLCHLFQNFYMMVKLQMRSVYAEVLYLLMKHNCQTKLKILFNKKTYIDAFCNGVNKLNNEMNNCWVNQCDCLSKEAYEKYQRINYIKEKIICLRTMEINETPDTIVFTYTGLH